MLVSTRGGLSPWQFYMPVGTQHAEFGERIGLLFWDRFGKDFAAQPFQICGCETGGTAVVMALQAVAYHHRAAVNVFTIKKERKRYGIKNWLEGRVSQELPVMLVDDIVAWKRTLTEQGKRLAGFGLKLMPKAFAVVSCQTQTPGDLTINGQIIDVSVLFGRDDFAMSQPEYAAKYRGASQ